MSYKRKKYDNKKNLKKFKETEGYDSRGYEFIERKQRVVRLYHPSTSISYIAKQSNRKVRHDKIDIADGKQYRNVYKNGTWEW